MAKGSRGGRRGGGATSVLSLGGGSNIPTNAVNLSDKDADQLRQQQDSVYDANTTSAVKMYISDTNFDQQGHSLSQTMNYLLDNGVDLNNVDLNSVNKQFGLRLTANDVASMQYTNSYMEIATHTIGKDVNLVRGAHDDILRNVYGIQDYSKMTAQQLSSMLVGQKFSTTSYMSTSYDVNKNPFLSSSSGVSGGREVVFNIKAGANTKMLFGAKKQSEIILDKGTNFKITGVRYSGKTARPRNRGAMPQLIIDIETI